MTEEVLQFTEEVVEGVKAEVLAGLVRVYKALVVAHDLFMAG